MQDISSGNPKDGADRTDDFTPWNGLVINCIAPFYASGHIN